MQEIYGELKYCLQLQFSCAKKNKKRFKERLKQMVHREWLNSLWLSRVEQKEQRGSLTMSLKTMSSVENGARE